MNRIESTTKTSKTKLNGAVPPRGNDKIHADHSATTGERVFKRMQDARNEAMEFFSVPTWKRALVAFVSGTIVGGIAGTVMLTLTDWLLVGAIAAGTGFFLQMVLAVVGFTLAMYVAWKVSARVVGAVLTGEADDRAIAAYDATKSMLSRINPMRLFAKNEDLAAA